MTAYLVCASSTRRVRVVSWLPELRCARRGRSSRGLPTYEGKLSWTAACVAWLVASLRGLQGVTARCKTCVLSCVGFEPGVAQELPFAHEAANKACLLDFKRSIELLSTFSTSPEARVCPLAVL